MKKVYLLSLLMALLVPWAAKAQETLTVCDGTTQTTHAPFYGYWCDVSGYHTEQIYPASMLTEMNGAAITSLTFYSTGHSGTTELGPLTVAITETENTEMGTTFNATESDAVFTGTIVYEDDVMTIEFDEPYVYGGGNLAIGYIFDASSSTYTSNSIKFMGISTNSSTAAYLRTTESALIYFSYLPKTTFTYNMNGASICRRPNGFTFGDISIESTTFSFNGHEDHTGYTLMYAPHDFDPNDEDLADDVVTEDLGTSTEFEFTDLQGSTTYYVKVKATCSDGGESSWASTNFVTPCVMLTQNDLPITEDFEGLPTSRTYSQLCWSTLNFYNGIYPNPSTSYHHTGSQSLYFYPGYSYQPQYLISPAIDDVNGLMITFYYLASNYIDMTVGYMTDPSDSATFVDLYTERGTGTSSQWSLIEQPIAAPESTHYIAIRMRCYTSYGYPAYIDDINIGVAPSCTRPASLSVSNVGTETATATINDPSETGNYVVTVKQGTTVVETYESNDTEVELSGLTPGTVYTVEAYSVCDDGNPTSAVSASFTTACVAWTADDLPYTDGFEDYTASSSVYDFNPCWLTSTVYISTSNPLNGSKTLFLPAGNSSNRSLIALTPIDEEVSINTLEVTFSARMSYGSSGELEVGVMTDANDASTFTAVSTFNSFTTTYQEIEANLGTYTGEGHIIALRFYSSNYYGLYLDDLTIAVASSCARPTSASVDSIGGTYARVNWATTTAGSYEVEYHPIADAESSQTVSVSDATTASLENLEPNTEYEVNVRSVCADENSNPRTTTFRTGCLDIATADMPYTEGFEDMNASSLDACWMRYKWNYSTATTTDAPYVSTSYAHTGSKALRLEALYYYDYYYLNDNTAAPLTAASYGDDEVFTMALMPKFEAPLQDLILTFWYKNTAPYNIDLRVGVASSNADTSDFQMVSNIRVTDQDWHQYEVEFANYTGTPGRIAFLAYDRSYDYSSNYAYIDDITVSVVSDCRRPNSISFDAIGSNEASISWVDSEDEVGSYHVTWTDGTTSGSDDVANATSYTISNLSSNTLYTVGVSKLCDGDYTIERTATFRTECGTQELPYTYDCEDLVSSQTPSCYTNLGTGYMTYTASYYHGGSKAFEFYPNGQSGNNILVLPIFEQPTNLLKLDMWHRPEGNPQSGSFSVGYITDLNDTASFVPVATYQASMGETYAQASITFEDAPEDARIAMRHTPNNTSWYWFVDDITVSLNDGSEPITCNRPTNLRTTNVGTTTATLDWNSDASEWKISVDNGAEQTVSSHPYTLTDLMPNSSYSVRVKAVCDDGQESTWATVSFTTEAEPVQGIDDVASASVSLAPNPATSTVSVSFEGNATVSVLDMSGREVLRTEANSSATLDVSRLARGTYFVRIGSEQFTAVRKLVVK